MGNSDLLMAWRRLAATPGLGPARLSQIATKARENHVGITEVLRDPNKELLDLGFGRDFVDRLVATLVDEVEELELPEGVVALTPDDEEYPIERIGNRLPLPIPLYIRGNAALLKTPAVAIAGSRHAHKNALAYAYSLAQSLARSGHNVVSGHAAGVDEAAHAGAISVGGTTTAVLAEGFTGFTPRAGLQAAETDSVLFVSGFEPDAPWKGFRAMERNATIAALSEAVVVVSAGTKGGSWEQGKLCLSAGKPLYVPHVSSDSAPGNEALIRMGAIPLEPNDPEGAPAVISVARVNPDTDAQMEMF